MRRRKEVHFFVRKVGYTMLYSSVDTGTENVLQQNLENWRRKIYFLKDITQHFHIILPFLYKNT